VIELARRGRPSAAQLADRLEQSRQRGEDLRDELRAERLEGSDLARRALGLSTRLEAVGRELGSPSVMQAGLELGYHASRFLRQRPEGSR
jgi:hypothetical protein